MAAPVSSSGIIYLVTGCPVLGFLVAGKGLGGQGGFLFLAAIEYKTFGS
jgi:hypothetical protein